MNEALLKIVKDAPWLCSSINCELLKQHTRYIPHSDADQIRWEQVRHLYIMHEGPFDLDLDELKSKNVLPGYYVDPEFRWVLDLAKENATAPDHLVIDRCGDSLELLHVLYPVFATLDLSGFPNLKCLRLRSGEFRHFRYISGFHHLHYLEELVLDYILWKDNLDVSKFLMLKDLQLITNQCRISGIDQLPKLQMLALNNVELRENMDFSRLTELRTLTLLQIKDYDTRIQSLGSLTNLEHLVLGLDSTGTVMDVSQLTGLKRLEFWGNTKLLMVRGLAQLENLQILNLGFSGIREIPDEIQKLKKLTRLDLSGMNLSDLPNWLPELGLRFNRHPFDDGINLYELKVDGVDMSIFNQPQEVILQWFEERKRGNAVPLNEVKVVFLGDGEAGKTHTIARLLKGGEKLAPADFDGKATPGIVIKDMDYELDDQKIQVHFWDFGGQEILHSMHRMFLTDRTLYVVIINARDDTQDDRARYWLHNIKSFAGSAPVLLVLNKIDQNPNASIDRPNLQKMYGGLKDVVRMSALEYDKEKFNATFTQALLKQVQELGTLGTLWPRSWLKLKSGLEDMKTHYIHGSDYEDLCDDCGVEQNREELLRWFNDLGVSFCYGGSAKLEDYVILKPEWLTNAIYIILFNECKDTENGVIPHEAIYRMLRKPRNGQDPIRRVLKDVFYRPEEAEYVLDVIRKFRLSYKVREDAEFIPVLCQRESMAVAEEYENDPDALEFQMEFEYLPDNVIHRLMVEMRKDLDIQNVWRTGARFVQQGTGLSAVVRSEGEDLRIFVRSDSPLHQPNTYLHIIKGNIDQIIADMKLQKPYCEVIYKAEGITEAFDYEDLIAALKDGETTYRSKKLRRRIPIQNILNQSGRTAEVELNKLRTDIITACMQLQGNSKFWDATEDEWNTAVRDALRNMKYLVNDQSFQGISGGEKKAGELDLEIRKDARIPWTIYEALKIKDCSKTAWNAHLEKLLDNYNPSGLNYLFLVTYVDCDKDSFQGIWDFFSEYIKWFNPGKYERMPSSYSHINLALHNNPNYIRAVRCTYDRAGSPTTVCHIFVRMGR